MADAAAFIYGWIAGIFAVVMWILYGIDTLLRLMQVVNGAIAHVPGFARLAHKSNSTKSSKTTAVPPSPTQQSRPTLQSTAKFDVFPSEEALEGLTGSTKRVTPITAGGLCMLSWYGADGSTGPPIECRLWLENNEVTIFQLLRVGDNNFGAVGSTGGGGGGKRHSTGRESLRNASGGKSSRDSDINATRSAAGVTMAEHRKGRVSVLNTTVMELKHFNRAQTGGHNNNTGSGTYANESVSTPPPAGAKSGKAGSDRGSKASVTGSGGRAGASSSGPYPAADAPTSGSTSPNLSANRRGSTSARAQGGGGESGTHQGGGGGGATRVDSLFTGRVLIWRTMDGHPLFESTSRPPPPAPSGTNGAASFRRARSQGYSNTSLGHTGNYSMSESISADSLAEEASYNTGGEGDDLDTQVDGEDDALTGTFTGSVDGSPNGRSYSGSKSQRRGSTRGNSRRDGGDTRRHSPKHGDVSDMANWSCVIIKFERARESERWYTLLSGLREARAWHDFAKTLPNPDTINTFLTRFLFQNVRSNGLTDLIVKQIRKKLLELPMKKFPRNLGGQLILDDFLIGTQIPWITDVSEPTVSANGEVGFDFNLLYKGGEGGFTLFFRLALEFLGVRVPNVVFSVKLIELEATVHISIGPPPSKKFWIGGHKPPVLRLEVHQGCASGQGILHRVLTSLPDLSGIMTNLIKLYLFSDMVLPYMDDFPLPSVVKSPKGSLKDLRVRTFDRQRAALISGAKERSRAGSDAQPSQNSNSVASLREPTTTAEKGNSSSVTTISSGGEHNASASRSADLPLVHAQSAPSAPSSRRSSTTEPPALPFAPRPPPGAVARASASAASFSAARTSAASPLQPEISSPTHPSKTGVVDRTGQPIPAPPRRLSSTAAAAPQVSIPSAPAGDLDSVRNTSVITVSSPVVLDTPSTPHHKSRTRHRVDGDDGRRFPSFSSSATVDRPLSFTQEESTQDDLGLVDSTDVLSSTTKRRSRGSSAVHNLKDLLKRKGKDMTRESVSQSKDRRKS